MPCGRQDGNKKLRELDMNEKSSGQFMSPATKPRQIGLPGSIGDFDDFDIAELLRMLRRGAKTAIVIWVAMVLGCYAAVMYLTEQYEAEAKLLVQLGRENAEVPLSVEKGGIYATGVQKEEINSYINLMTSLSLIEATVDAVGIERFEFTAPAPETLLETIKYHAKAAIRSVKEGAREVVYLLGLKKRLTDRQAAVKLVQKSLSASRERDSNVIALRLSLPDGELARETLETLIGLYLARHVELNSDGEVGQVFQAQTDAYREELQALQDRMAEVRADWSITSVPEQRAALIARLEELETATTSRLRDINRIEAEEAAIREEL